MSSTLELITKASSTPDPQYPILLNPHQILLNLKPQNQQSTHQSLLKPVQGWSISQIDTQVTDLAQKFFKNLKIKLKNPNSFTKNEFVSLLNSYLEKINEKVEIFVGVEFKDEGYAKVGVEKLGFLMGDAVIGLVLEACLVFQIWGILETLIVNGLVNGSCYNSLVCDLVERNRAHLVCLCVKHVSNLRVEDVLLVLKFFLSPSKDGYMAMIGVRKEWESQAVSVIEMAMDKSLDEKKLNSVKDAAVLLMMAHDEFTTSELCLHYLIALPHVDDVIFSACVGKLNGLEIMGFVRYLKKWLIKYQKFPHACSISKALSSHGLKVLESVPSLEHVIKCFGLIIDEHFSSLVMHPEFLEEVKSVESVVNSLASEARLCCNLANLCAGLNH